MDKRTNIIKARAKAAKLLLEGKDVPPPVQEEQLSLARHVSTRYVPTQRPFSSLGCAKFLRVEHVKYLAEIFSTYNVIPTTEVSPFMEIVRGEQSSDSGVSSSVGSPPQPPGGGGGGGTTSTPTSSTSPSLPFIISKGGGIPFNTGDASPPDTPLSSPIGRQKNKQSTVEHMIELSADQARFTPGDLAISREWFVECILCIVAEEMEAAAAAALPPPSSPPSPSMTETQDGNHRRHSKRSQRSSVESSTHSISFSDTQREDAAPWWDGEDKGSTISSKTASLGTRAPSVATSVSSFSDSHDVGDGSSVGSQEKKKPRRRTIAESFSFLLHRSEKAEEAGSSRRRIVSLNATTDDASSATLDILHDGGDGGIGKKTPALSAGSEALSLEDPTHCPSADGSEGGGLLGGIFGEGNGGQPPLLFSLGELPVGAPLPTVPLSPVTGAKKAVSEDEKKPTALHQAFGAPNIMVPLIIDKDNAESAKEPLGNRKNGRKGGSAFSIRGTLQTKKGYGRDDNRESAINPGVSSIVGGSLDDHYSSFDQRSSGCPLPIAETQEGAFSRDITMDGPILSSSLQIDSVAAGFRTVLLKEPTEKKKRRGIDFGEGEDNKRTSGGRPDNTQGRSRSAVTMKSDITGGERGMSCADSEKEEKFREEDGVKSGIFLNPQSVVSTSDMRRRAKEEELRRYRQELLEWLKPLCHILDSHHGLALVEGCVLQVQLLERFHAAGRQTVMRSKRGNQLFMNNANMSVFNNCGVLMDPSNQSMKPSGATKSSNAASSQDVAGDSGMNKRFGRFRNPASMIKSFLRKGAPKNGEEDGSSCGGQLQWWRRGNNARGGPDDSPSGAGHSGQTFSGLRKRKSSAVDARSAFIQELFMGNNSAGNMRVGGVGQVETQLPPPPPPVFHQLESKLKDSAIMKEFVNVSSQYVIPLVTSKAQILQEDKLSSMVFFGENADEMANHKYSPHWVDLIKKAESVSILAQIHRERPITYPQGKRRKLKEEYFILCWSDITNNLIMDFEQNQVLSTFEISYSRVQTMMLEEDNSKKYLLALQGVSRGIDGVGLDPRRPDLAQQQNKNLQVDEDEDEENKDWMSGAGSSSRRPRGIDRKQKMVHLPTSAQADLETFAEELKGLHTQSADKLLIALAQPSIITSSKDGVIKVWETRYGHFTTNLLNVGSAWVLGMWLLHDDHYMLVSTSNAELTILEFPKGAIQQKFRGCTSLISAMRQVTQMGSTVIHRYGLRPGECGPHRTDFKKNMGPDVYKALFREAQISSDHTIHMAKPIEGYVAPSAVYFDPTQCGLFFFGNTEGVVGYFDLTHEIKQSTILSGANNHPISIRSFVHAHNPGVRVVGVVFVPSSSYVISVGEDGSVVRTTFTRTSIMHPSSSTPLQFGGDMGNYLGELSDPQTLIIVPRPVRFLEYCLPHRMFATAHSDRRVVLWSLTRYGAEFVHQFPPEAQDIISITFLGHENHIAFLTADRCIRIYHFRGMRPLAVIYPSRFADNNAEDVASVTLKCSKDDPDGCLGYLPETGRLICALRAPVMYERTKVLPLSEGSSKLSGAGKEEKGGVSKSSSTIPNVPLHIVTTASIKAGLPLIYPEDSDDFMKELELSTSSSSSDDNKSLWDTNNSSQARKVKREEKKANRLALQLELGERRLEKKRLRPYITLPHSAIAVIVHAASGVVHTFSPRLWKSWDVLSGSLIREVDMVDIIRSEMPMFKSVRITSCGWTTEHRTRLLAGARNGHCVTLDASTGAVVEVDKLLSECRLHGEPLDKDISSVFHVKNRTFICSGRTIVVRRYNTGAVRPSGEELFSFITLRIPVRTTITACCVIRGSHLCVGTIDTKLYFFRLIDLSGPYHEEVLYRSLGGWPTSPLFPPTSPSPTSLGNPGLLSTTGIQGDPAPHHNRASHCSEPEISSVVGITFVNDLNQNLLFILLDSGVMFVYSTLRACFLARFRVLKPGIARVRCFTHLRHENLILIGTTTGNVLGLELSQCSSAEVDFKQAIRVTVSFSAATSEITGIDTLNLSLSAIDRIMEKRHSKTSLWSSCRGGNEMEFSTTVGSFNATTVSNAGENGLLTQSLRKGEGRSGFLNSRPLLAPGKLRGPKLASATSNNGGIAREESQLPVAQLVSSPILEKNLRQEAAGSPISKFQPHSPRMSSPNYVALRFVVVSSIDGNVRLFRLDAASSVAEGGDPASCRSSSSGALTGQYSPTNLGSPSSPTGGKTIGHAGGSGALGSHPYGLPHMLNTTPGKPGSQKGDPQRGPTGMGNASPSSGHPNAIRSSSLEPSSVGSSLPPTPGGEGTFSSPNVVSPRTTLSMRSRGMYAQTASQESTRGNRNGGMGPTNQSPPEYIEGDKGRGEKTVDGRALRSVSSGAYSSQEAGAGGSGKNSPGILSPPQAFGFPRFPINPNSNTSSQPLLQSTAMPPSVSKDTVEGVWTHHPSHNVEYNRRSSLHINTGAPYVDALHGCIESCRTIGLFGCDQWDLLQPSTFASNSIPPFQPRVSHVMGEAFLDDILLQGKIKMESVEKNAVGGAVENSSQLGGIGSANSAAGGGGKHGVVSATGAAGNAASSSPPLMGSATGQFLTVAAGQDSGSDNDRVGGTSPSIPFLAAGGFSGGGTFMTSIPSTFSSSNNNNNGSTHPKGTMDSVSNAVGTGVSSSPPGVPGGSGRVGGGRGGVGGTGVLSGRRNTSSGIMDTAIIAGPSGSRSGRKGKKRKVEKSKLKKKDHGKEGRCPPVEPHFNLKKASAWREEKVNNEVEMELLAHREFKLNFCRGLRKISSRSGREKRSLVGGATSGIRPRREELSSKKQKKVPKGISSVLSFERKRNANNSYASLTTDLGEEGGQTVPHSSSPLLHLQTLLGEGNTIVSSISCYSLDIASVLPYNTRNVVREVAEGGQKMFTSSMGPQRAPRRQKYQRNPLIRTYPLKWVNKALKGQDHRSPPESSWVNEMEGEEGGGHSSPDLSSKYPSAAPTGAGVGGDSAIRSENRTPSIPLSSSIIAGGGDVEPSFPHCTSKNPPLMTGPSLSGRPPLSRLEAPLDHTFPLCEGVAPIVSQVESRLSSIDYPPSSLQRKASNAGKASTCSIPTSHLEPPRPNTRRCRSTLSHSGSSQKRVGDGTFAFPRSSSLAATTAQHSTKSLLESSAATSRGTDEEADIQATTVSEPAKVFLTSFGEFDKKSLVQEERNLKASQDGDPSTAPSPVLLGLTRVQRGSPVVPEAPALQSSEAFFQSAKTFQREDKEEDGGGRAKDSRASYTFGSGSDGSGRNTRLSSKAALGGNSRPPLYLSAVASRYSTDMLEACAPEYDGNGINSSDVEAFVNTQGGSTHDYRSSQLQSSTTPKKFSPIPLHRVSVLGSREEEEGKPVEGEETTRAAEGARVELGRGEQGDGEVQTSSGRPTVTFSGSSYLAGAPSPPSSTLNRPTDGSAHGNPAFSTRISTPVSSVNGGTPDAGGIQAPYMAVPPMGSVFGHTSYYLSMGVSGGTTGGDSSTGEDSGGGGNIYDMLRELPKEVLEQRRDQLMLAFMAQRLDKVHPQGSSRHSFLDDVKRVWVRRVGEAQVVAETRAAVFAATNNSGGSSNAMGGGNTSGGIGGGGGGDQQKPQGGIRHRPGIAQMTNIMNQELQKGEAGSRVELNLNLLTIPTEEKSAQEASAKLSARERLKDQLKALQKQREVKAEERHQLEDRNPNPRDKRYWLPLISAKQPTHPIRITLPSTLRGDEGARHQLRQLHHLVAQRTPLPVGTTLETHWNRRKK